MMFQPSIHLPAGLRLAVGLISCVLLFGFPVLQAEETAPPKIGDAAPGWKNLTGTDDEQHSFNDLKDAKVVVVCFTCNTCPYAVDYEERLVALQKKYTDAKQPVRLVAINSNAIPADGLDRMKARASERSFNFPYLKDESQDVARQWGAIYTPEFFVVDQDRKLIYRGAMDDNTDAAKVQRRYVEEAVAAGLAGTAPEVSETGARGCTIRFKRRRR
ncbi:MAG: thioredoxin family protein [Fuerstiella sp.]